MHNRFYRLALSLTILLLLTACAAAQPAGDGATSEEAAATDGGDDTQEPISQPEDPASEPDDATDCDELTPVSLQLQWVAQSQFAGYYAAQAQGFYAAHCLEVTILEGAIDIVPQQVVASGQAEFGIAWVPKVLASRAEGADLVNIGQVFQRSGTLEVSWADDPVPTVADMAGKRVGTWGFGNEHELFAAMRREGIDPNNPDDVEVIQQNFDMVAFLNRELDAAQAEIYNRIRPWCWRAVNPETGELYQPEDMVVIDFNDVGTAMLQDHVFAREANGWPKKATRTLPPASWPPPTRAGQFCRDEFDACVQIVLDNGPTLGQSHMAWQLNEINRLIWPSPAGIGLMDEALWQQTVDISVDGEVIPEAPAEGAYRTDLTEAAHELLEGDVTGESYEPIEVELVEGGE